MATWLIDPIDKAERASGYFNATVRDYARLGWPMANDGSVGEQTNPSRESLLDMTDPLRQPAPFRPGTLNYRDIPFGYGLHTWLAPGSGRRFVAFGSYGQAILVDPALKLVMVHTAVEREAAGGRWEAERAALWQGVVQHHGGQ